jgi:hypothetical protein
LGEFTVVGTRLMYGPPGETLRTVCLVSLPTTWRAVKTYVSDVRHNHDESQPNLLVGPMLNSAAILAYPNPEALLIFERLGGKPAVGTERDGVHSAVWLLSTVP